MPSPFPSPPPGRCFLGQRKVRARFLWPPLRVPRPSILIGPIEPPAARPRLVLLCPCAKQVGNPQVSLLQAPSPPKSEPGCQRSKKTISLVALGSGWRGQMLAVRLLLSMFSTWSVYPLRKTFFFLNTSPDTDLDECPLKIIYKQVKINGGDFLLCFSGWWQWDTPRAPALSLGWPPAHADAESHGLAHPELALFSPAPSAFHRASKQRNRNKTPTTNLIFPLKHDKANSPLPLGKMLSFLPFQASLPQGFGEFTDHR